MSHHESKLRADPVFYAERLARIREYREDAQARRDLQEAALERARAPRRPCAACGRMFPNSKGQRRCSTCRARARRAKGVA